MSLPGHRFTYQDYRLLAEDKRYELIEGDLLLTPSPNARHQAIQFRLVLKLGLFVEQGNLGAVLSAPTDVILSEENVVQPDILFVAAARVAIIDPKGGVNGAPDLVFEILSPTTASRDRVFKRKLYSRYGVREYWIVDPDGRSVEILARAPSGLETVRVFPTGSVISSPLLPGLSIPVDDVFRE